MIGVAHDGLHFFANVFWIPMTGGAKLKQNSKPRRAVLAGFGLAAVYVGSFLAFYAPMIRIAPGHRYYPDREEHRMLTEGGWMGQRGMRKSDTGQAVGPGWHRSLPSARGQFVKVAPRAIV
jgi:hypothetical protein